jgi:cell division protein FtsI (penicillin-binding protein 3)
MNRITAGKFELGSTMKTVTAAAALDSGKVKITDTFDARFGVRFGRYTIDDFHGKHRILSVPEIYKYSSNIGTIHMMQALGKDEFRAFLTRIGFDAPLAIELPEKTRSAIPAKFSEVVAATASFGHGMSITPLHMASAMAAFVNDGNYVPPTMYKRSLEEARAMYVPVIQPSTSRYIRYLMRLNALEGSGTRMNKFSDGYRVGGKTGTAEKVINGRYAKNLNMNVFTSAFPLDNPRYAMLIIVDEPKRENPQSGETAGWNAGEVTGRIVAQVAPMLGIAPDFSEMVDSSIVPMELR